MKRRIKPRLALALSLACLTALAGTTFYDAPAAEHEQPRQRQDPRQWLAGDHHIHSQYSVDWDETTNPPTPIVAGDAIYPIPTNAEMAKRHGLSWMVSTDHGGPNHSKVNLEMAYPELLEPQIDPRGEDPWSDLWFYSNPIFIESP